MENFEPKFYPNMVKPKETEGVKTGFDVMKMPEITVKEERGAQLFSLLLKAADPKWGETETSLVKETIEYFRNNPTSQEILKNLKDFHAVGISEEALYNIALTYQHPERAEKILEMAKTYKPPIKNPQEICQKFLTLLENFDQTFSISPLAKKINAEIEQARDKWLQEMQEIKKRIEIIINFLKPDSKTTNIRRLNFIPIDPLYKKNAGRNFSAFPDEQIIISHIDNILNQNHEFSHGIINPIIKKLSRQLTEEQKEKIPRLASEKLKRTYGNDYFILLCEEFVRTYTEIILEKRRPQTFDDFIQKISKITEDQFNKLLVENARFEANCKQLDIKTTSDLKNKSKEYFERFEINRLRDLIFGIYQEYLNRPDKENENFEKFILKNFSTKIQAVDLN